MMTSGHGDAFRALQWSFVKGNHRWPCNGFPSERFSIVELWSSLFCYHEQRSRVVSGMTRQRNGSVLVQIMARRLLGTMALPADLLNLYQIGGFSFNKMLLKTWSSNCPELLVLRRTHIIWYKQRFLTPGHQGWNDLHSLCRIGMEYYLLNNDDNNIIYWIMMIIMIMMMMIIIMIIMMTMMIIGTATIMIRIIIITTTLTMTIMKMIMIKTDSMPVTV